MPTQKRLAMVLADLAKGGIGKMRVQLANEFARRGIAVDLVLARGDSPYLAMVGPGVDVRSIGTSHALLSLPGLVRYLRGRRPDVVLTQRIRVNVAVLRARRLARVQVPIWTTINTNESAQLASLRPEKARKHLALLQHYYPRNDGLIAISDGVADDAARLIRLARERIVTIYNPTVTPDLVLRSLDPLEHPWFAPDQPPVILGVGRLEPQKDFATLVDAFARVRAVRRCRLIILGEGELRNALASQVQRLHLGTEVQLPGFVDNPYSWMARAAVFAFSSRWEGFGNALVEAMACGTPVVSTDCPDGPREILSDGQYGRLVAVGDAEALADAIAATLAAPLSGDRLREAADRFTLARSASRYLQILGLE